VANAACETTPKQISDFCSLFQKKSKKEMTFFFERKTQKTFIILLCVGFSFTQQAYAGGPVIAALQAQDWKKAEAIAGADATAQDLVRFARMLSPGQATALEIGAFAAAHPTWPDQALLHRRLAAAIVAAPNTTLVLQACAQYKPTGDAVLRCADAERDAGQKGAALWLARQAWIGGITDAAAEQAFLADWVAVIRPEDQWRRFDALDWTANPAADRQADRLDLPHHALAQARLAFRHNDKNALATLPAVPEPLRADPALLLAQARWLRGNDAHRAALALWRAAAATAESAASADRRPAFWNERDRLARLLLADGDNEGAYALADDSAVGTDQAPDALFLAGWIALRRLHDPARAAAKFHALAAQSQSIITQGRAWYWLARTAASDDAAKPQFKRAAAFPTSYYGQLAALRLGTVPALQAQLAALHDPDADNAAVKAFDAAELTRAANILASWGDPARARAFLLRGAQLKPDAPTLALTARRGLALGLPDVAVAAARLAGRQGIMLRQTGWPRAVSPPTTPGNVDPALVLALMRQESSFDAGIVSHAGAIGLMQLMPETARQAGGGNLTDPAVNMRLGEIYLGRLLKEFGGVTAYALAAYNAGPHRAHAWIVANGDAAATNDPAAMLDWIELIPFTETRNYVQRVLENRVIYAAPP
jgi:soluble lytic murein transglycosylase